MNLNTGRRLCVHSQFGCCELMNGPFGHKLFQLRLHGGEVQHPTVDCIGHEGMQTKRGCELAGA